MKHFCIPRWLCYLFAAVMVAALLYHWEHVLTYAPFLFLLLCPLMHFFHGHGNHRENTHIDAKR